MEPSILSISHLKSGFFTMGGYVPAVDDVSIEIPKGKIVGIVGESGCGKSMTARSVMGLIKYPGKVTGGSVTLEGRELLGLSQREMRKIRGGEISMIFQEPMTSLNPVMKVGRQVAEALRLHKSCTRREAKAETVRAFEKVGISEPEKRYNSYPHELSGGLRQRVMIAMAMICGPKLLIADEPTTALDVTIEAQILHLMKELRRTLSTSILLISHNLGVIAELCDYVYVMYAGKIVEQGDTVSLFRDPRHPYTQGLLQSIVPLDGAPERLHTIPGAVPNLLHLPKGCAFAPRCPMATERCRVERPELTSWEVGACRCFCQEGAV